VTERVIHLVKAKGPKVLVTKCGAKAKPEDATMWYTEATCLACRPFEYVKGDDGALMKVPRGSVESSPKVRVMKRLPKRAT